MGATLLVCATLFATPGRALEQGPHVSLDSRSCSAVSEEELRRMLAAELGATVTGETRAFSTRVNLQCDAVRAKLLVYDPLSRKSLRREIAFSDVEARARGRLLAIAAAELVTASWAELDVNPSPRVEPAGPAPPPQKKREARAALGRQRSAARARQAQPRRRGDPNVLRALAVRSVRRFLAYDGALHGGGVRVGQDFPGYIGWMADTLIEGGDVIADGAKIETRTVTAGGALFVQERVLDRLWIRGGAGLRAGWVRVAESTGADASGLTNLVPWGWPLVALSCSVWPSKHVLLELHGESSYVKVPRSSGVSFDDQALRGMWVSVQLAVGLRLNR